MCQSEVEAEEDTQARTPLSEVREDDELWGEVTKVSNYGAFLDVGVEVPGFLHVIYYPKKPLVSRDYCRTCGEGIIIICGWC